MNLTVYLAGHIHDNWRSEIRTEAHRRNLNLRFVGPQENHSRSDGIGEEILGKQESPVARDATASQINNLRTRILMAKSDVVVALFGKEFRQWNTAMDASLAIALGKPVIIIRDPSLQHALKELSDRAQLVVEQPNQALDALMYVLSDS